MTTTLKPTSLLSIAAFCLLSTSHAEYINSTLLVNFTDANTERQAQEATANDFLILDPAVLSDAPVNVLHGGSNYEPAIAIGLTQITVTVSSFEGSDWNTDKGHFKDTPILDSYLHNRQDTPLMETISIEGFDDIPEGQIVTLTVWGVGDVEGSDTDIAIEYNGQATAALHTEYDRLDKKHAAIQFSFSKASDAHEVIIKWGRHTKSTVAAGLAGFSMTTAR